MNQERLKNKTAVVTGGASGIGAAIARRFAAEGAEVILFDRNQEAAAALAEELSCRAVPVNVSESESVREALELQPRVDILVNSAGIAHIGNVETTQPEDLDRLYAVNVKGVYLTMHFALPKMLAQGGGAILNIASVASKIGIADRFAYSMTKGAVLTMTLSVARDYVSRNIRCNCICPARVHTPFIDGYLADKYPGREAEMFQMLSAYQPIGRMGEPCEMAALAAFLCSEEASFITGSAYDIDGGVTLLR
jgi:NAD(P)-dependent dehydrogenase (short-subunit alcohol dehydrogenase family)